jgi:TP901 family phage tail tape measure protein
MPRDTKAKFVISAEDRSTKTVRRIKEEFRGLERDGKRALGGLTSSVNPLTVALGGVAGVGVIAGLRGTTRALGSAVNEYATYEKSLVGVVKTTDLAGKELETFEKKIAALERRIPVTAQNLNTLAASAGQLGVSGSANLLKFTETLARLEQASDVVGEEGARSSARLLNLTDTELGDIDRFGAALVALGNDAAATEAEILHMATFVGQSLSRFDVDITQVLGLSTAMKELGLRAELSGASVGRAFGALQELPQLGGEKAEELARLMGAPLEEIQESFRTDAIGTFLDFLERLQAEGEQAGITLNNIGLSGSENARVFPVLANAVDQLRERLAQSSDEYEKNTALIKESNAAFDTHEARVQRAANTYNQAKRSLGEYLALAAAPVFAAFNEGADNIATGRDEQANPFGDLTQEELEGRLDGLIDQFEELDAAIAGVSPLPEGVTDPFAEQDKLTVKIASLKDRLELATDEQIQLARENVGLRELVEERKLLTDQINAAGLAAPPEFLNGAALALTGLNERIAAQEKLIRSLKGVSEADYEASLAAKDQAEANKETAARIAEQAAEEEKLVKLSTDFAAASETKIERAQEEIEQKRQLYAVLVEEGRITQDQLDEFVRVQSVKLGLLEEELNARGQVVGAIDAQTAAERRQAEAFANSLETQEERLERKIEDIRNLSPESFAGLDIDQGAALGRAEAELEAYRDRAAKVATEVKTTTRTAFDEMGERAKALKREFETPFEELQRRVGEIRELEAGDYLSADEAQRFTAELYAQFDEGADQIESRFEDLRQTVRGSFRRLLGDTDLDFQDFALGLAADLAANEFDRLIFGDGGLFGEAPRAEAQRSALVDQVPYDLPVTPRFVEPVDLPANVVPFEVPVEPVLEVRNGDRAEALVSEVVSDLPTASASGQAVHTVEVEYDYSNFDTRAIPSHGETVEVSVDPVIDTTLLGDRLRTMGERAKPAARAAGEAVAQELYGPIADGPSIQLNTFSIVEQEAQNASSNVADSWDKANRETLGGFDALKGGALEIFGDLVKQAGDLLGGLFSSETGGVNLGGVFGSIFGGLGDLFGFGGTFAGGGYTGNGPRAGGIDGQGGFPAILHPQEEVIDFAGAGRQASASSQGMTQVVNIEAGVSQNDVPRILEAAAKLADARAVDVRRRKGRRARARGVA